MIEFNGLIQHSFALRLAEERSPFDGRSTHANLAERFDARVSNCCRFCVVPRHPAVAASRRDPASAHTLLGRTDLTTVRPVRVQELRYAAGGAPEGIPPSLAWAGPGTSNTGAEDCCGDMRARPQMTFAELEEQEERISGNDFRVVRTNAIEEPCERVARWLLGAVAFRRSQLFGLAISKRFVNVMLPCAKLTPTEVSDKAGGSLLLLALVSLMRDGSDRTDFRRTYSLTLYALPVKAPLAARKMRTCEIQALVNAGWGLAEAIPEGELPGYEFSGPLRAYVERLAVPGARALFHEADLQGALSFRMVSELVAYAVALRMAEGSHGRALEATKRSIGDDVVTTLGTARVSAALLVDPALEPSQLGRPIKWRDPPGSLRSLMQTLARDTRAPDPWTPSDRRKHQLDRPFVDSSNHAIGILPANRCLLMTYAREEKRSDPVPLLSLVAGVTFMTVGSATAIGTMRSIDHSLERLEHDDPCEIAQIDGEIAADLHEIYDLDISNETYRSLYRRLCRQLGITRDYETLQDKMQTLYRAASTLHDDREQKQLVWLTAAIVVLSLLILLGTFMGPAK
jgi:hypothetical protein